MYRTMELYNELAHIAPYEPGLYMNYNIYLERIIFAHNELPFPSNIFSSLGRITTARLLQVEHVSGNFATSRVVALE